MPVQLEPVNLLVKYNIIDVAKHVIDPESNPPREVIHVRYRNDELIAFRCSEIRRNQ